MTTDQYDLIIFDCDGTLVDTEGLQNQVSSDLLIEFGLSEYTPEKCSTELAGKSWTEIKQDLDKRHNINIPRSLIDDYVGRVKDLPLETLNIEIKGAIECVRKCQELYKIAVGSNGERFNVIKSLQVQGFMDYFTEETIFTKIQVENPKPAPDLFLLAASTMNVEPARCLVIEDSLTGVKAGVAAGMDVWGFTGVAHDKKHAESRLKQAGATHIFDDFIHMEDMLKL